MINEKLWHCPILILTSKYGLLKKKCDATEANHKRSLLSALSNSKKDVFIQSIIIIFVTQDMSVALWARDYEETIQ